MKEEAYKKVMLAILVAALLVLAFIIVRPIIVAILFGLILAYIFSPLYRKIHKYIKSENLSAGIVVIGIIVILALVGVFTTPVIANQMINVYVSMQDLDIAAIFQETFPALSNVISGSADLSAAVSALTTNVTSWFLLGFQRLIFNIPSLLLQTIIVFFTFFFMLRDYDATKQYFLSVSPFSSETQKKFYNKFEEVTNSILYGQLVVGITQGIIAGIGYFIFGLPNALLLTILTMLVGIIPVIGPWLIWIPADIYLFLDGRTGAGIGLLVYGVFILSWIDSLIRPLIVSRMTKMNSAIALIGMIGGLYLFGVIGLIIGPLVLAYLLLVAEFYKQKKVESILLKEEKLPKKKFPIP
jgi:predicted PurR-regulated permease PerM